MRYFYVICPVSSDQSFTEKKSILLRVRPNNILVPFFPLERRPKFSLKRALADIAKSEFVIADLSFERPSCYFELGLAQAVGKRTYLFAGDGTRIHQFAESLAGSTMFYSSLEEYGDAIGQIIERYTRRRLKASKR